MLVVIDFFAGRGDDKSNATKGNKSAGGSREQHRYSSNASDIAPASDAPDASTSPVALDPDRFLWGCCRQGTHVSDPLCSCVSVEDGTGIEQVQASRRASLTASLGTRLSQRGACKAQRPSDTPKTRFFVAQFETKADALAYLKQ